MRDGVEVALKVGVHDECEAFLDQSVYLAQSILAASLRPEAVACRTELHLEYRLNDELQRRLHDPILDRRYAQRPRPAIAFPYLPPFDRLRALTAPPQPAGKPTQIQFRLPVEPLDTLTIDARCAFVGLDPGPGRLQRFRRHHLVDQTEPTSSFDADCQ